MRRYALPLMVLTFSLAIAPAAAASASVAMGGVNATSQMHPDGACNLYDGGDLCQPNGT